MFHGSCEKKGQQCVTSCSSSHPIGMCQTLLLVLSSSTQCQGWALFPFCECATVCISVLLTSIFD